MRRGQPQTILIVDDDDRLCAMLREALEQLDYQTLVAANGREALDIVEMKQIDCVISDIKMPELDGLTLLRRIRMSHPDLPVVIITGHAYEEHKKAAAEVGAAGFLMKPFRLQEIEETLKSILSDSEDTTNVRTIRDVLIVEDNPEFCDTLGELIGALGYNVSRSTSAEEAIVSLGQHLPDAAVIDYKLPGMSGEDLITYIKSDHPALPVVLITGFAPSTNGREFANGTVDAFLMKPFRIDRIGEILKEFETVPQDS